MKVVFEKVVNIEISHRDDAYISMTRGSNGDGFEYGSTYIEMPLDTAIELCDKLTQIIHDAKQVLNERMAE